MNERTGRIALTYGFVNVDWPQEESEQAGANGTENHLWEESWDDDDAAEDFSKQLKCVDFSLFLSDCGVTSSPSRLTSLLSLPFSNP